MRQKLCVTLAVAVLALSGARETCKQFNGLKSLAGEWSGVWNTMLVYASSYAEGAAAEAAPTLVASSAAPCRGETPVVAARSRRKSPRARPSARAKRGGATELRIDLGEVAFRRFAATPEATTTAAADKVSKPRLQRATVNPAEMADALAGEFKSAFDAEALWSLLTDKGIEASRAAALSELFRRGRAGIERKAARAERGGERSRVRNRFVPKTPDPARASEEVPRAGEAVEAWPGAGGDADLGEVEVFFVAPQPSSGLLNCDMPPRR